MDAIRFSLLAVLFLAVSGFVSEEAEAVEPEWTYGTEGDADSVAISADGQYTVVGSEDDNIYLFDGDGYMRWSYDAENNVRSVSISDDGESIVAGIQCSSCVNIYLFGNENNTPLWSYETGATITSMAISADGEYIVAQSGYYVYLFHRDSNTPLWEYDTGEWGYAVLRNAISANGQYIIVSSGEKVYLFDKDDGYHWSYDVGDYVSSVAISADGEYFTFGSSNNDNGKRGDVYLYTNGANSSHIDQVWTRQVTDGNVESIAISADGEYIAAAATNSTYFFHKDSSTPLWDTRDEALGGSTHSVAISNNGKYITAGFESILVVFRNDSSTPLWSYDTDNTYEIYSVDISADGEHVVAGSNYRNDRDTVYFFLSNSPPTATIDSIAPSPARFDAEITFEGSGTDEDGNIVAYEWYAEDDNGVVSFLSDQEDFSMNGSLDPQFYIISFRVQDNENDWSEWVTTELEIYGNESPTATIDSITPSPAEFEASNISFSGSGSDSDGSITSYSWVSSIDGELSTEADFGSDSLSLGNHNIIFKVQDNDGDWSDEISESLWIYALPVASANHWNDINEVETGDSVEFKGSGTDEDGDIVQYEWDFNGDGLYDYSSSNGDTSYTYNNEGIYTATLRVTDNDGYTDTDTRTISVDDNDDSTNSPPSATIDSISPSPATVGDEITFRGTGSDNDGTIIEYEWESDIDGFLSYEEDFSTTDLTVGTHTIRFRVQDDGDTWSSWDTTEQVVNSIDNEFPTATIDSISPSPATVGDEITFSGTGSDNDGEIVLYEWDFDGDGIFEWSSEENGITTHIYNQAGTYAPVLRVMDNDDNKDTDSSTITINSAGGDDGDDDGDGVVNADDECSNTPEDDQVDEVGCTVEEDDDEDESCELVSRSYTFSTPTNVKYELISTCAGSVASNSRLWIDENYGDSDGEVEEDEVSDFIDFLTVYYGDDDDARSAVNDVFLESTHTIVRLNGVLGSVDSTVPYTIEVIASCTFDISPNLDVYTYTYLSTSSFPLDNVWTYTVPNGYKIISVTGFESNTLSNSDRTISSKPVGDITIVFQKSPYPFGIPGPSLIAALGVLLAVARLRR